MKRTRQIAFIVLLGWLAAGQAWAQARSELGEGIGSDLRWADPSHVRLGVDFPGQGYHAEWELYRCACGDLLVRSELNEPGDVERGETVLVGGLAVLSRGFAGDPELGGSLDAPALMMQLALRLLERAEPGGPSRISEQRDIDLDETIDPIYLESYTASGVFQAPWSLRGRILPAGDTRWRFDLEFDFTAEGQQGKMRLQGQADFASLAFPLQGSDSLSGWQLSWRDEAVTTAAQPATDTAATLDELREIVRNR